MASRIHNPKVANYVAGTIEKIRRERRISQSAIGDELGVSYAQVQKYLSGGNRISVDALYGIAAALGVPVTNLLPQPHMIPKKSEDAIRGNSWQSERHTKAMAR